MARSSFTVGYQTDDGEYKYWPDTFSSMDEALLKVSELDKREDIIDAWVVY